MFSKIAKATILQVSFFVIIIISGFLVEIRSLCVLFTRTGAVLCIIIIYSSRVFHINVSRCFFTRVWVTVSLFKSPGFSSVFCPFSIMLSYGWFPFLHQISSRLGSLVTVPRVPITIATKVTFMFHSFCQFSSKVEVLIFLFPFLQFYSVVSWDSKVNNFVNSLFFVDYYMATIRWSLSMLKSHKSLCVLFSRTGAELYIYHLLVWLNLNCLHISSWIFLPTQSCLVLYSFCANLLHSLIMWLMVSYLSLHSLHLLFCWVLVLRLGLWLLWFMSSFMYLKKELPTFTVWRLGLLCWLLREQLSIIPPKPVAWSPRCVILWFDILMVYCGYTRPRVSLWSAHLTQM